MRTHEFCTYFDHRYFAKGMALRESLLRHCPDARLWVLCLSDECFRALTALALPGIVPVPLAEFEKGNAALAAAKANRSTIEYYFTCTPSLMDWVLRQDANIEVITYLDSDLFFFSDPAPIFHCFENYSTLIIEHRFAAAVKRQEIYGKYNVGWVSFRRDADGLACLSWWRDRCLEWCYDRLEGDRFADQKYLDRMPGMFNRVLILNHPGANLAPWNMGSHRLEPVGADVLVDGRPLIFFHFHGLKRLLPFLWQTEHFLNGAPNHRFLAHNLYSPYIRALARGQSLGAQAGLKKSNALMRRHDIATRVRSLKNIVKTLLHRDFVLLFKVAR